MDLAAVMQENGYTMQVAPSHKMRRVWSRKSGYGDIVRIISNSATDQSRADPHTQDWFVLRELDSSFEAQDAIIVSRRSLNEALAIAERMPPVQPGRWICAVSIEDLERQVDVRRESRPPLRQGRMS